ncbi:MAG: hypothetical protein JXB38_01555 [Anaerolineales bacterium]|nr:hypothetical protein [Anaerolineales bacterium]
MSIRRILFGFAFHFADDQYIQHKLIPYTKNPSPGLVRDELSSTWSAGKQSQPDYRSVVVDFLPFLVKMLTRIVIMGGILGDSAGIVKLFT